MLVGQSAGVGTQLTDMLYEGLVEPNVAKTLLQCFVQVVETFCWNQPKTNVVKTLYC